MSQETINPNKLKSDIRKFRISLRILTIFQILHLLTVIGSFVFIVKHSLTDAGIIFLWIFLIVAGAFILWIFQVIFTIVVMRYERKNIPITQKKKNDNLAMIMFTGIIGLWLWLPNKKEIEQIIKKVNHSNEIQNKTILT